MFDYGFAPISGGGTFGGGGLTVTIGGGGQSATYPNPYPTTYPTGYPTTYPVSYGGVGGSMDDKTMWLLLGVVVLFVIASK